METNGFNRFFLLSLIDSDMKDVLKMILIRATKLFRIIKRYLRRH